MRIIIILVFMVLLVSCENCNNLPLEEEFFPPPNTEVFTTGVNSGYRIGIEAYNVNRVVNVSNGENFYLPRGDYTIAVTLFNDRTVINSESIPYTHKGFEEKLFIIINENCDLSVCQFEIAEETLILNIDM